MPRLTFHLIPHTHWDREWYLTRATFVARLIPAIDEMLARLAAESGFRAFLLDGQTVLLEDYFQVRPEAEPRVRAEVQSGHLQIGPWYVLPDELIPSGESLVRNLLAGRADAERLGRRCDVMYSPDAFGHPAAWPTIAGEFGIRHGVLWRGVGGRGSAATDFFRWRGPDGQEVVLYHLPRDGYEIGAALPAARGRLRETWARVRSRLVERAATSHVAVFVGADHHAPHPDIGGLRDLLAQLEPGHDVRVSRLDDFLQAAAIGADAFPVIQGEQRASPGYTWTLQGVHSTRAPLKRSHGEAELWLERIAEPLAALALLRGRDRRPQLRHAWRALIRSQFHDSIGGCTSDPVAVRVEARLQDAEAMARELARTSLHDLAGHDPDLARDRPDLTAPRLLLWNPVPRPRKGVIIADLTSFRRDVVVGPPGGRKPREGAEPPPVALAWPGGATRLQHLGVERAMERIDAARHYPDQDEVLRVRVAGRAPVVPGLGLVVLEPTPAGPDEAAGEVRVFRHGLENGLVSAAVTGDGGVTLIDQRSGLRFSGLLRLESGGDVGDTYSYAPPRADRLRVAARPGRIRVLAGGPLVGVLEVTGRLAAGRGHDGSGVGWVGYRLRLSLQAGSEVLRCTIEVDNQASDHRLRLRMPTGLRRPTAIAGGAFGKDHRPWVAPGERIDPLEAAQPTAPAHRFVACADATRGLAVLAPGFFEYELVEGGDLLVTLLRAVGQLSREDLATRPGHAGWPIATPAAQCRGRHRLQLAIAPVSASEAEGSGLAQLWEDVFLPVRGVWLRQAVPLDLSPLGIELEGRGLVFSSCKPAEELSGVVLRCYNATAAPVRGRWRFRVPVAWGRRVRADERGAAELVLRDGGRTVDFEAGPRAVVTIAVGMDEGVT